MAAGKISYAQLIKEKFNQILDIKFGPVKVRALKTPKHVTVPMPPHPRQVRHRKERKVNGILPTQGESEIRYGKR